MDYLKISIIVLMIIIFSFLPALNLEDIYSEILVTYSKVETYEANFLQENYWKELDTFKQSSGKIYYDKDHLLLDYSIPDKQFLLIDYNSVTIFEPSSNQVIISNNTEVDIRPVKFISSYWDISEKTLVDSDINNFKIKLITPKKEQIFITIENLLISDFIIIDADMNSVHYSFELEKINHDLPNNVFELILPENANIIDVREK